MTEATPASLSRQSRSELTRALDNYGLVLILIIASIILMAALGDSSWADALLVVVLGATLLATLRASNVRRRLLRLATCILAPALALAVLSSLLGGGDFTMAAGRAVVAGIALIAPLVIVNRLVRHPEITFRTVLGALCVYLLVGFFFAFLFALFDRVAGPFFAQPGAGDPVDYLYFSYVTMSTVGYGDLTARGDLGRMLAVTEALIGQLYLVTIVALLVGNLGRARLKNEE
ncbi:MAG TPA: potassium channel family protein [Thermoleophilia bacterium]|nr:potassium channel family protein [Thermoleophilia bacterium]